jgi:phage shock protein C
MSVNSPSGPTFDSGPTSNFESSNPTGPVSSPPRLYRSRQDRLLGGVCGGLGQYFGIDPVIVRLAFVLLLTTGIGLLAYLVLWIVVPERPLGVAEATAPGSWSGRDSRGVVAWFLVFLGLVILLSNLQVLRWLDWSIFWPVLLIAIGAGLLARHSAAH